MKKTTCLVLLLTCFACCLQAEEYTIWFNSGESGSDSSSETEEITKLIRSSSDNCVSGIRRASKIYRAKDGFGIKGGMASIKGELVLELDNVYDISSMTVYACAYANKADTAATKGISVCGNTILWKAGYRTSFYPYTLTQIGKTDSIAISALMDKSNRFYIQRIDFTAPDPRPGYAKITSPTQLDLGTAILINGEPTEEVTDVTISARSVRDEQLRLNLAKGEIFSITPTSLPAKGGDCSIEYNVNKSGMTYLDTLSIHAVGTNGEPYTRAIPVQLKTQYVKVVERPVDSTCMFIGPMPCDYYLQAQGQKDSLLKVALSSIINCGVRYHYGSGKKHTWEGFFFTDRDTVTNRVLDMYSNEVHYFDPTDTCASVQGFDIEHMLPKSWWGGSVNEAYCDLFHLVPANASANRSKSNHAPGFPADSTFNNGSFITGSGKNYGLTRVFCPEDKYKGDFARAYFYIATCYDTLQWKESGEAKVAMTNNSYLEFRPWLQDILLQWHRMDPVSQKEMDRAIAVNKIQGNRNPFIDYPELVEYIWGNKQGQTVDFKQLTQSFGDKYCDEPTGCKTIRVPANAEFKVLKNGQVIIQINGHTYTVLGFAADK